LSLNELLATQQATELAAVQRQAPTGWQAGREVVGSVGVGITRGTLTGVDPDHRQMLKDAGFDPDRWTIVGDVHHREWDAQTKTGIQVLVSRRFNARLIGGEGQNIDDLLKLVRRRRGPSRPAAESGGGGTFVLAQGDFQLGKGDGDGTSGTVDRIVRSIDQAAAEYRALRRLRPMPFVHLPFLGDCIEGFVSQGGRLAWRTELTLTEQLRLTRRLMLYTIDQFAPLAERVTAVSVPGNHDEATREPMTRFDDSFAVDALVAVQDAMLLNSAAYGHVETVVPRTDELTVTMDVNGTVFVHLHGHQFRPGKHWEWWKGQAFGGSDAHQATVMLHAHSHHFHLDTKGQRTAIMAPAQESRSQWWVNKTGEVGAPGALIFTTEQGKARDFSIV
jgi:predicted phosphodiesterase